MTQKTAMAELIEKISTDRVGKAVVITFEKEFKYCLEKEKQQIVDAHNRARRDAIMFNNIKNETAEEYYNQTYNQ
jgi:hypothetical protein